MCRFRARVHRAMVIVALLRLEWCIRQDPAGFAERKTVSPCLTRFIHPDFTAAQLMLRNAHSPARRRTVPHRRGAQSPSSAIAPSLSGPPASGRDAGRGDGGVSVALRPGPRRHPFRCHSSVSRPANSGSVDLGVVEMAAVPSQLGGPGIDCGRNAPAAMDHAGATVQRLGRAR